MCEIHRKTPFRINDFRAIIKKKPGFIIIESKVITFEVVKCNWE